MKNDRLWFRKKWSRSPGMLAKPSRREVSDKGAWHEVEGCSADKGAWHEVEG